MLRGSQDLPGIPNNLGLSWNLGSFHYFWNLQIQHFVEIQGNLVLWMSLDGMAGSEIQYNLALAEICDSLDLFWNLQNRDCSWHQDNLVYLEIQDNLVL